MLISPFWHYIQCQIICSIMPPHNIHKARQNPSTTVLYPLMKLSLFYYVPLGPDLTVLIQPLVTLALFYYAPLGLDFTVLL